MAKAKAKTTTKKQLAKKEEKALAPVLDDLFGDEGGGYEEADTDAYSIPFLSVLQPLSPQCQDNKGEFIEEARPGMLFNSATCALHNGAEGVLFVPCLYQRRFNEWTPRDQGGGYHGSKLPEEVDMSTLTRNEKGQYETPQGTYYSDTRNHYGMVLTDSGPEMVVLSLTSTQIKASRNWMTGMQAQRAMNPKTKKYQSLPMYGQVWRLKTVSQSNEKGTWKVLKPEFERLLTADERDIFAMGKDFKDQILEGAAKAAPPSEANSDDIAF